MERISREGVYEAESVAYIRNYIFPIYLNSRDVPGKSVLIKVNRGMGRLNIDLLAKLIANGFALYSVVPNFTAVTQEMGRNYSPFKTAFRQVFYRVVQQQITKKVSVSLLPTLFSLIVFGGINPETG